jgi:hypothetical protein
MQGKMVRTGIGLVLGAVLVGCGGDVEKEPMVRTIRVVEHADTDVTEPRELTPSAGRPCLRSRCSPCV